MTFEWEAVYICLGSWDIVDNREGFWMAFVFRKEWLSFGKYSALDKAKVDCYNVSGFMNNYKSLLALLSQRDLKGGWFCKAVSCSCFSPFFGSVEGKASKQPVQLYSYWNIACAKCKRLHGCGARSSLYPFHKKHRIPFFSTPNVSSPGNFYRLRSHSALFDGLSHNLGY